MSFAGPLLVVSPHLDDAVLSCGRLLQAHPGAVVATVFAGRPARYGDLTEWDRASGFAPGDDPVARGRREGESALALLGARPVWLDFLDSQYGRPAAEPEIGAALEAVLREARPGAALIPLGLFHSDHDLAHRAALALARRSPGVEWLAYEDALYRRLPGLLEERLERLRSEGLSPRPLGLPGGSLRLKRRAIALYRSQLRALATPGRPGHADALEPEGFWSLS